MAIFDGCITLSQVFVDEESNKRTDNRQTGNLLENVCKVLKEVDLLGEMPKNLKCK
jgi:hypothetical protein